MAALLLAGPGLLPACRRGDARQVPAARDERRAVAEQEALAFMAPGGSGAADRRVLLAQDAARRTPGARALVALGEAWIQKARNAADPGLYLNAEACAALARARTPGDPGAQALLAAVHLNAHRFEEARATAESALRADPGALLPLGILADALVELGRYEEASAAVDRMMARKPSLPAYARASYLLWLRGRTDAALEAARRALDAVGGSDPEPRAWMLVQAAMIFWHRGDADGAAAGFDLALATLPGFPPALVGKARIALAREDAPAAAALLDQAWRTSPQAETAWLLGDARAAAGDAAGARAAYAEVERLGRKADGRVLAAFLAARGERTDDAVRLAEEQERVRPDIYSDDVLAWALFRAGRLADARARSDAALRLGTPDARLLYHAAAIRAAAGDRAGGRALARRALALNPGFDPVAAADARRIAAADGPRAQARRVDRR